MEFTKMSGAGNDFLILNNLSGQLAGYRLPELAKELCNRRFSVGADGLMVVMPPRRGGDFAMLFFNSDGTLSEMCGNGARCICRYGYERGLSGQVQHVETTAGMITGWRLNQQEYRIQLNNPSVLQPNTTVEVDGVVYPCAYVELGKPGIPHAVVPMPGLENLSFDQLRPLAAKLRRYRDFSKGANVNFYDIAGEDQVVTKTFERGVEDFTYACGTGVGSTVAVLTTQGKVSGRQVRVQVPGGELVVDVIHDGNGVQALFLTGPTKMICTGEICDGLEPVAGK